MKENYKTDNNITSTLVDKRITTWCDKLQKLFKYEDYNNSNLFWNLRGLKHQLKWSNEDYNIRWEFSNLSMRIKVYEKF